MIGKTRFAAGGLFFYHNFNRMSQRIADLFFDMHAAVYAIPSLRLSIFAICLLQDRNIFRLNVPRSLRSAMIRYKTLPADFAAILTADLVLFCFFTSGGQMLITPFVSGCLGFFIDLDNFLHTAY